VRGVREDSRLGGQDDIGKDGHFSMNSGRPVDRAYHWHADVQQVIEQPLPSR